MDNEVRGVPEFQPKPTNNGNLEYQFQPQVQVQVGSSVPVAPNGRDPEFEREMVMDGALGSDIVVCLFVDPNQPGIKFNDATPSDRKIPGQDIPEDGKFEAEVSSLAVAEWDEAINSNNGDFSVRFDSAGKKIITIMVTEERMLAIIDKLSKEVFSERVVIETGLNFAMVNDINKIKIENSIVKDEFNKSEKENSNVDKFDNFNKDITPEFAGKKSGISTTGPIAQEFITKPASPSLDDGFNINNNKKGLSSENSYNTPNKSADDLYREFLEVYNDYKRRQSYNNDMNNIKSKPNGDNGSSDGFGKKG